MTSATPAPEIVAPIEAKAAGDHLAFRPLSAGGLIMWGLAAAVAFHLAYELFAPAIFVFVICMYRLGHAASRPRAMYSGWVLGLAIYGPQLGFFWNIFGVGALGLWLVLSTWLSIYLVLQRFALLKLGPTLAAIAAPFLWTGVEYFRSELYYLRFSWVNVGYAFSPIPVRALIPWLGMYGAAFLLMLFAAHFPFFKGATRKRQWMWTACLVTAVVAGALWNGNGSRTSGSRSQQLKVAGVQLEFADEQTVVAGLDRLAEEFPNADLHVLSEYTFGGAVPASVTNWCRSNRKYLVAGGKDYIDASETQFRNTAFVIGPDGDRVFSQVKAVPIQFFKDGLPADQQTVWDSPWGKLGVCVCYDLSYTRVTDELIRQGAQGIIVPTMDVEDWGERQHVLHARVAPIRAAEHGVPIFRLCSSGISQAVDARGKVLATAAFPGQGELMGASFELPPQGRLPIDRWLVWPCVAMCAAFLAWHVMYSFGRAWRRVMGLLLAAGLLAGCASGPRYDEQVLESYRVGMAHEEVHELLKGTRLMYLASRPSAGWAAASKDDLRAARAAAAFEQAHTGAVVQTCEVYWIPRHTSVPVAAGGVWFDYLYFDSDKKLLGWNRRFVD
jgi:apolipoprotein N-acyltransferase